MNGGYADYIEALNSLQGELAQCMHDLENLWTKYEREENEDLLEQIRQREAYLLELTYRLKLETQIPKL